MILGTVLRLGGIIKMWITWYQSARFKNPRVSESRTKYSLFYECESRHTFEREVRDV